MSKKILVISSSFRQGSNSDMLADRFIEGASEAGCDTEKVPFSTRALPSARAALPVKISVNALSRTML